MNDQFDAPWGTSVKLLTVMALVILGSCSTCSSGWRRSQEVPVSC